MSVTVEAAYVEQYRKAVDQLLKYGMPKGPPLRRAPAHWLRIKRRRWNRTMRFLQRQRNAERAKAME